MVINAEIYRVINRAIVIFTLLFDETSNDFRPNFTGLDTQAARSQVFTQLYEEVFLNLSNSLF